MLRKYLLTPDWDHLSKKWNNVNDTDHFQGFQLMIGILVTYDFLIFTKSLVYL